MLFYHLLTWRITVGTADQRYNSAQSPLQTTSAATEIETLTPLYNRYYNARNFELVIARILNVKLSGLLSFHIISTATQGGSLLYCTLEALANARLTVLV